MAPRPSLDMDYPEPYIETTVPLVFLSGLGSRDDTNRDSSILGQGFKLSCSLPCVSGGRADLLRDAFERRSFVQRDTSALQSRPDELATKFIFVGREYIFPARKAAPAAQTSSGSPPRSPTSPSGSGNPFELHSPLSPLSSVSPLFPTGLMTPHWLSKHGYHVPAVFVLFVALQSQPSDPGDVDARLKAEVNTLKSSLARSGFRTRLVVVLVPSNADTISNLEERLVDIRWATGLDAKTSLFYFPDVSSSTECDAVAEALTTALRSACLEYYRELTKHARRKRGRGFLPVTMPSSSKALSTASWNARYDFKMGIFAELRAEWETAEKHHLSALDNLFSDSKGALAGNGNQQVDTLLFADVTAMRTLRCQLWRGANNAAAAFWAKHKTRVLGSQSGSDSFAAGQLAWTSNWAATMADLVESSSPPVFAITSMYTDLLDLNEDDESRKDRQTKVEQAPPNTVFTQAEPTSGSHDRSIPFHNLHHPGYWYALAAATAWRQNASQEQAAQALELNQTAIEAFARRSQTRSSARLSMHQVHVLLKENRRDEAIVLLRNLWQKGTWRTEQWWRLCSHVLDLASQSALATEDTEVPAECGVEALCGILDVPNSKITDRVPPPMSSSERLLPLSISFAFANARGHVGDAGPCQVVIVVETPASSQPPELKSLVLEISTGLEITIEHTQQRESSQMQTIELDSNTNTTQLTGAANLRPTLESPLVLNLAIPLSNVGDLALRQIRSRVSLQGIDAAFVHDRGLNTPNWWLDTTGGLRSRDRHKSKSTHILVLPKPPRIQIRLPTIKKQYCTDEMVKLDIELVNEENADIDGRFRIDIVEQTWEPPIELAWESQDVSVASSSGRASIAREVTTLPVDHCHTYQVRFNAPGRASMVKLALTIDYRLASDTQTTCTRTLNLDMTFVSPFELALTLLPRHDTTPWPSFFALPDRQAEEPVATGVPHAWLLEARVTNSGTEDIHVDSAVLVNNEASSNLLCKFNEPNQNAGELLRIQTSTTLRFPFVTQVKTIEHRSTTDADISVAVTWHRHADADSSSATTIAQVPRYLVPPIEPRVLCTMSDSGIGSATVQLTLENPSMHFLTFNASLAAGKTFGFSGPKRKSLSLTPMSRVDLEYNVYLYDGQKQNSQGQWIPLQFAVVDAFYHKTLKILAADQHVRNTSGGDIEVCVPSTRS